MMLEKKLRRFLLSIQCGIVERRHTIPILLIHVCTHDGVDIDAWEGAEVGIKVQLTLAEFVRLVCVKSAPF